MLEITIGVVLVTILLFDLFQSVLVPRYTPASLRLAPLIVSRFAWPHFRRMASFIHNEVLLDFFLGSFAPLAFLGIFAIWLFLMVVSFGLIVQGLGAQFHPQVHDFGTAMYTAGTALLTLGFGDIVASTPLSRFILLFAAATGITVVAISVSFLFSMQQSVHQREVVVHTMQARIGNNPSAVNLLCTYADLEITDQLVSQLNEWEIWISQVLTSHRSFPLLCYFRSGHLSVPWVTIMGIMLDTANLLSTTINDRRFGHAEFLLQIASRSVNIFRNYFKLDVARSCVSEEDFRRAYRILRDKGYQMHDEELAWQRFHVTRSQYAPALNAVAFNFVCPISTWLAPVSHGSEFSQEAFEQEKQLNSVR